MGKLDDSRRGEIVEKRHARHEIPVLDEIATTMFSRKTGGENAGPQSKHPEAADHHYACDHATKKCLRHGIAVTGSRKRRNRPPQRQWQAAKPFRLTRALECIKRNAGKKQNN